MRGSRQSEEMAPISIGRSSLRNRPQKMGEAELRDEASKTTYRVRSLLRTEMTKSYIVWARILIEPATPGCRARYGRIMFDTCGHVAN